MSVGALGRMPRAAKEGMRRQPSRIVGSRPSRQGGCAMGLEVFAWGAAALLLCSAETLAPGAFMLWLGFAAVVVFAGVLLMPGLSLLVQVVAFIALSFVSIQVYRTWFRGHERISDQPMLNRRAAQLVGRVVPLERGIVNGRGSVQIADEHWDGRGPGRQAGARAREAAGRGAAPVRGRTRGTGLGSTAGYARQSAAARPQSSARRDTGSRLPRSCVRCG